MKKSVISILALSLAIASCNKDKSDSEITGVGSTVTNMNDLRVPASFDWETAKGMNVDVTVKGIDGMPLRGVRIDIYDVAPDLGGKIISSGFTNANGVMEQPIKIPTYLDEVFVLANTVGIDNRMMVSTKSQSIRADFGGVPAPRALKKGSAGSKTPVPGFSNVYYLGTFNGNGVPNYLTTPGVIDPALLSDLSFVLPEAQSVPCTPSRAPLVSPGVKSEITTSAAGDVYVTFVGDGAGFKNALAYYYYPESTPPAGPSAVDSIFVIFPNASMGSGNLQAGDRVKIGNFPANTVISWVLLQNDWDGSAVVKKPGHEILYSRDALNTDMGNTCAGPTFKRHTVSFKRYMAGLPNDTALIFGFEDITYPSGDFDFNDVMWYAEGNFKTHKIPIIPGTSDCDNDGVDDSYDDYPCDPTRACDIRYQGTVAFEDLWPSKGDYDFNDNVVAYDVIHTINASGELLEIKGEWTLRASGAGFDNGFGFQFKDGAPSSKVANVTGTTRSPGKVAIIDDGNGTEASGDPSEGAIVIAWNSTKSIYTNDISGGAFFNTVVGGGAGTPVTENININMVSGVPMNDVGLPPYNAFIFANQDRSKEIHLADHAPTSNASTALFGTADDDSQVGGPNYYQTGDPSHLPWGIHIIGSLDFDYPIEKTPIIQAYHHFAEWAENNGGSYANWYTNAPGYRDNSKIY